MYSKKGILAKFPNCGEEHNKFFHLLIYYECTEVLDKLIEDGCAWDGEVKDEIIASREPSFFRWLDDNGHVWSEKEQIILIKRGITVFLDIALKDKIELCEEVIDDITKSIDPEFLAKASKCLNLYTSHSSSRLFGSAIINNNILAIKALNEYYPFESEILDLAIQMKYLHIVKYLVESNNKRINLKWIRLASERRDVRTLKYLIHKTDKRDLPAALNFLKEEEWLPKFFTEWLKTKEIE